VTPLELHQIVDERMHDPGILGCIASNLRSSDAAEQQHHGDGRLKVEWRDCGDFWECTIADDGQAKPVAKVNLHDNATVRIETFAPCRVTISQEEGFLCLTR
jgi:hypothetical protein